MSDSPAVLFVTRSLAPDDPSPVGRARSAWLASARRVARVDLVAGYVRGRRLLPEGALGVDLCGRKGLGGAWSLRRATWRRARAGEPDLVVSAAPDAPRCRRPSLALVHEAPDVEVDGLTARATLSRLALFHAVAVPCPSVRDQLVERGLDADRVHVVPPGLEGIPGRAAPGERLRIVAVGPMGPRHGAHTIVDAVARLAPVEKARVHLDVVGPVDDPVYHGHLAVQAHGQPIRLHTDLADPAPLLSEADLVVHVPIVPDATALDLTRAALGGQPVVWSDHAILRWATAGLGTAVPPGDVLALRATLREHLKDPQRDAAAPDPGAELRARWGRDAAAERLGALLTRLRDQSR